MNFYKCFNTWVSSPRFGYHSLDIQNVIFDRVSYRGGALGFLPRNLEIEYAYYCFVTCIKQQSCLRLCQKQSEMIYIHNFSREGGSYPHARLHMLEHAFTCYYDPATIQLCFPLQLKILYKTLFDSQLIERSNRCHSHKLDRFQQTLLLDVGNTRLRNLQFYTK